MGGWVRQDVFCNTLTDPEWATLAEGADGNMRVYHVSEAMNPHSEYGPVPMDVSLPLVLLGICVFASASRTSQPQASAEPQHLHASPSNPKHMLLSRGREQTQSTDAIGWGGVGQVSDWLLAVNQGIY
eukprot:2248363-Rhodomonas_salina.3